MLIMIGTMVFVPLVAVISFSIISSYQIVKNESFLYAEKFGEYTASQINLELTGKLEIIRTLAFLCADFRSIPSPLRRKIISSHVRSILKNNPDIVAAWVQLEPGAIEDDSSVYKGTKLTAPNGGFDATWYRVHGKIIQGSITDDTYNGIFYTIPKLKMEETIIDPYFYSYTGKENDRMLETSICVPVITDNKFKGVAGLDIALSTYQNISDSVKVFKSGYASIIAGNGMIIAHPQKSRIGSIIINDIGQDKWAEFLERASKGKKFYYDRKSFTSGNMSRQFFFPINIGNTRCSWFFVVVVPFSEITLSADKLTVLLGFIGTIAAFLIVLSILLTAVKFSHPIIMLTDMAEKIAAGDLSVRANVTEHDEIGRLARTFNTMTGQLQLSLEQYNSANRKLEKKNADLEIAEESLKMLNMDLEKKVSDKTAELLIALENMKDTNYELELSLENLNIAQEQIIASEKMAVLGTLVASIAHELNTPLGAISSSAGFIIEANNQIYSTTPEYIFSLDEENRKMLMLLIHEGRAKAAKLNISTDRTLKKKLLARLISEGISHPDTIVENIETLDAFENEELIIDILNNGNEKIIEIASNVTAVERAISIISNAVEKASGTVMALVDYSRKEEYDVSGIVEPIKEIETILVLYYNRLKHGVLINRNYNCTDPVTGYRDRLNQIWINLINNALQAMEYNGTLSITTERDGNWIAISFTDTGPGIPANIKNRIFEPFFSTKNTGEGTGLGLDICKKIIDKHEGKIEFRSIPGETTFTVLLRAADIR